MTKKSFSHCEDNAALQTWWFLQSCVLFLTLSFFPLKRKTLQKCILQILSWWEKIHYSTADYMDYISTYYLFLQVQCLLFTDLKQYLFYQLLIYILYLLCMGEKKGPLYAWVTSALKVERWRKFSLDELITVKKTGQVYCPRVTCAERININLTPA